MIAYRCYFLGEDGKIKNSEMIECPTDAAALEEAERRLAACDYPAIEVWEMARRIGTVGRSKGYLGLTAPRQEATIAAD
jgi:hypothetical protein